MADENNKEDGELSPGDGPNIISVPIAPPTGFDMEIRSLPTEEIMRRLEAGRAEKAAKSVEKAKATRSVTKKKKIGSLLDQIVAEIINAATPEERAAKLLELGLVENVKEETKKEETKKEEEGT